MLPLKVPNASVLEQATAFPFYCCILLIQNNVPCKVHLTVWVNSSVSQKKQLDHTWLCVGISPLLYGLRTWSKCQKTRQVVCTSRLSKCQKTRQVVCTCSLHSKFFLVGGCGFFVSDIIRTFWPPLPGPGRQLLDGSISLKFLLETRLQSESFDTLDDLLGFRGQSCDLS